MPINNNFPSIGDSVTSDDTACEYDILEGKTAHAGFTKITGTIKSIGPDIITPTTYNQYINSGVYLRGGITVSGSSNLKASNIKNNVNIFGVRGSLSALEGFTISEQTITIPSTNGKYMQLIKDFGDYSNYRYHTYRISSDENIYRDQASYTSGTWYTNASLPIYSVFESITNASGVIINTPDFGEIVFEGPFTKYEIFSFQKSTGSSSNIVYGIAISKSTLCISSNYFMNSSYAICTDRSKTVTIKWLFKK